MGRRGVGMWEGEGGREGEMRGRMGRWRKREERGK
jgi:hypothetical protein